ncbi:MAG: xylulokinase [Candidatus Atribacteria bacterium]|nr:xylulokinase [Candidatus Atribacteria bacterium]
MAKLILAHDLGTTGNKATLFDENGCLIDSEFFDYDTFFPDSLSVEQNPEDYWEAVTITTRKLIENSGFKPDEIAVVSFSGQMMGALPVDSAGNPLHRILIWADRRGVEEVDWVKEKIDEDQIYQITGHRLSPNYSLAKILWLKNHFPDVYKNAKYFLMAKDYIVYRLTGQFASDYSDASGTNLFDLVKEEWSEEILNAAEIDPNKLPPLYSSAEVVGEVTPEAARETGLLPGTPVVIGGGDGPCAAVGAGVVRAGQAYNYLGSSSWIALASNSPFYDSEKRNFTFHHLAKGLFMPTGTMQAAGGSYQWCRDAICEREKAIALELGISPYDVMNLEASKVPAGAESLLFLPYLLGERAPWWNPHARGTFIGLTARHRKPHIIRAVLEGVSFNLRIILDAFREQGMEIENMRMIGGGARGAFWAQVLSSMFNLEILRPKYLEEATSLGAAITGGIGVGIFPGFEIAEELIEIRDCFRPFSEDVETYNQLYPIFIQAYKSLVQVFECL